MSIASEMARYSTIPTYEQDTSSMVSPPDDFRCVLGKVTV